jgi:hypothetical protein
MQDRVRTLETPQDTALWEVWPTSGRETRYGSVSATPTLRTSEFLSANAAAFVAISDARLDGAASCNAQFCFKGMVSRWSGRITDFSSAIVQVKDRAVSADSLVIRRITSADARSSRYAFSSIRNLTLRTRTRGKLRARDRVGSDCEMTLTALAMAAEVGSAGLAATPDPRPPGR